MQNDIDKEEIMKPTVHFRFTVAWRCEGTDPGFLELERRA